MTAISQPAPVGLTTTPPAEISRTMAPKLTEMKQLVIVAQREVPRVTMHS